MQVGKPNGSKFEPSPEPLPQELMRYSLLNALMNRRTRRFAKGMTLDGGPLSYKSAHPTEPLGLNEEAALAFAACGVTGYPLLELPFESGAEPESGTGNIIAHLVARTVASAEALHPVVLFVINDDGAWMLKRPQDYPRSAIGSLVDDARRGNLVALYEKSRVPVLNRRPEIPHDVAYMPPFNKWSANVPGSSYFLPVNELSAFYINMVLSAFQEENAYFIIDDRNRFQPAGIGKFARSRGGYLNDDPARERVGTVSFVETWLCEFTAIEQGSILQNLALMTQALGLGGFAHFAAHPYIWLRSLGFRIRSTRLSRTIGAPSLIASLMRALNKDPLIPWAAGLERGEVLIKPFCPPYYRNMEEAVLAFIEYKFGARSGTLRTEGKFSAWLDGPAVQAGIPAPSDRSIAATIAYCDYIYRRYGRFPAISGPFRTVLAHQAHHLDNDFYDKFYRADALTETQRTHDAVWHSMAD